MPKTLSDSTSATIIGTVLEEERRVIFDEVAVEPGIPRPSVHHVLIEGVRQVVGRCLLHDSARPHIALTIKFVSMDYKQKTQPLPVYVHQMISLDFGIFPKPERTDAWPKISVFRNTECCRGRPIRHLSSSGQLNGIQK